MLVLALALAALPTAKVELSLPRESNVRLGPWEWTWRKKQPAVAELPAGTYLLEVTSAQGAFTDWVTLDAGTQALTVTLERPVLRGQVVGPDGRALAFARVHIDGDQVYRCGFAGGHCAPLIRFTASAETNRDGGFSIPVLDPGEYRVTAWSADAGIARVVVKAPGELTLRLEPGRSIAVQGKSNEPFTINVYDPRAPVGQPGEPLFSAQSQDGVARFDHLAGALRFQGISGERTLDVTDAGRTDFWLGPRPKGPTINGKVADSKGKRVTGTLCGYVGGSGNCAALGRDGTFTLSEVEPQMHVLQLDDKKWTLARRTIAMPGDDLTLTAVPKKKAGKLRAVDPSGKPIADATLEQQQVVARGYLPVPVMKDDPALADRVVMQPLPVRGHAPPGAAVAFLCEQPKQYGVARWWKRMGDAEGTRWSRWPHGVQCIVATVHAGDDGAFSLDAVPDGARPIAEVEARLGERTVRVPFVPGAPLELALP